MLNKHLLSIFFVVCFGTIVLAQGNSPYYNTVYTPEMMQRLMRNRAHEEEYKTLLASRSNDTIWVPTVFHSIGRFDGSGKGSDDNIYKSLCKLNEDYAPYKIQFYLASPILYHDNPIVFYYQQQSIAASTIESYITPDIRNAMNIVLGGYDQSACPAPFFTLYNPQGDYIYITCSGIGDIPEYLTQNVANFFSLPYVFNGWDDTYSTARAAILAANGGNAPLISPDSILTEYVSRDKYKYDSTAVINTTGAALTVVYNRRGGYPEIALPSVTRIIPAGDTYYVYHDSVQYCRISGDYFCSTGADYNVWLMYMANAGTCPSLSTAVTDKDPDGVLIRNQTPFSNYMNYSGIVCTDRFEADQVYAIKFDALARNYGLNHPVSNSQVTGTTTILSPASEENIANSNAVALIFTPVPNATHYNIKLWRITGSLDPALVAYGTTSNPNGGFVAYNLAVGERYKILVKAYNDRSFCSTYQESYFTAGNWATGVSTLNTLQEASLQPNPSEAGTALRLEVIATNNTEGTMTITNLNGQVVKATNNVVIAQGLNLLAVETDGLAAGMYILTLKTPTGMVNIKLGLN